MRVSTPKSEAMVLCWKMVNCTLWFGSELLPHVKEFKYLWVLFTSEGKMDVVLWALYCTVVVKGVLRWKAKLSIYQLIYFLTLTFGHELWVETKRMR